VEGSGFFRYIQNVLKSNDMTTYAITTDKEKKDKKRSLRIAVITHGIVALLLLIPIASQIELTKEPAMTQVVMVDFNDFKAASAQSSTKAGAAEAVKEEVKAKPVEAAEPKPEKPKAPVKAAPVAQTKEPTKIITRPEPKPSTPKTKAEPTKAPSRVKVKVKKAPTKVTTTAGTPGKTGTGTQGNSTKGDAKTDGKIDKGEQGMDFEGEALFTRRVIRRAEIKQLSKKKGTIVVNLCVNQNGSVVYADFNKADSNIYDTNLVKEAIEATYKYRFEPDYTAPAKQCGKLTYIIKIK